MKNGLNYAYWAVASLFLMLPAFLSLFFLDGGSISFLFTSFLFASPILILLFALSQQPKLLLLVGSLFVLCNILEITMLCIWGGYIQAGNILSILGTDVHEAEEFVAENWVNIGWFIPEVVLLWIMWRISSKVAFNVKTFLMAEMLAFFACSAFVCEKLMVFYEGKLTVRYYVENRILNRPPYNFFYQMKNVSRRLSQRNMIENIPNVTLGAKRDSNVEGKEVYFLLIGESWRYSNCSFDGQYERNTTPLLKENCRVVSYPNYYSAACLTMFSVPQILTMATPLEYERYYSQPSIFRAFKEVGFKTFCVVNSNLLAEGTHVTKEADSLIVVHNKVNGKGDILEGDMTIPHIIDSLCKMNDKVFIVAQFLGCHSYYSNFPLDCNLYFPNIKYEESADKNREDLYLNAYDNTIMYADRVFSSIIDSVDKYNAVAAGIILSDHGENVSSGGGGHGGDCKPQKNEYHVPFLVWHSNSYDFCFQNKATTMLQHKNASVCSDNVFYSLCGMADITLSPDFAAIQYDIFSPALEEHPRYILLPDGVNSRVVP